MNKFVSPTCTETVSGIIIDLADPQPEDIKIEDIAWALSRQARYAGHTMSKIPYTVGQHTVMVSQYVEEALTEGTVLFKVMEKYINDKITNTSLEEKGFPDANSEFAKWIDFQDRHIALGKNKQNDEWKQYALHGLMHDFAEAYLVDLPTPVKRLPGIYEAYKAAELRMDTLIMKTLGLQYVDKWPANRAFGTMLVHWADMYALMIEAYHFMPSRGLTWNLTLDRPSLPMIYGFRWPIEPPQAYEELLSRYEELKPSLEID